MRKDKKGQAAMEFLMTYGWAILAAIVVIGILGYYYFSSDVLTPRTGVVQAPFYLNAWNVNTTHVNLELKNNGGETYTVQSIDVGTCTTLEPGTEGSLESGETEVFGVDCGTLNSGDSFSGDITIKYTRGDSELEQTSTGSVTDVVA